MTPDDESADLIRAALMLGIDVPAETIAMVGINQKEADDLRAECDYNGPYHDYECPRCSEDNA